MLEFLILKWLHIISSVVLVGVGFGSAFYLYFINRSRNVTAMNEVLRLVVRADFWFTTPAVIVQPVTGIWMIYIAGYELTETWLLLTYALFGLAGLSWLPVVWLQIKMAAMASVAEHNNCKISETYWYYARWWQGLGMIAFPAMLAIFALMVFKPG